MFGIDHPHTGAHLALAIPMCQRMRLTLNANVLDPVRPARRPLGQATTKREIVVKGETATLTN